MYFFENNSVFQKLTFKKNHEFHQKINIADVSQSHKPSARVSWNAMQASRHFFSNKILGGATWYLIDDFIHVLNFIE